MCCVIHSLRNQTPMRPAALRAHWCKSTWSMLLLLGGLEAKGARVSTSTPPLNSAAGGGKGPQTLELPVAADRGERELRAGQLFAGGSAERTAAGAALLELTNVPRP